MGRDVQADNRVSPPCQEIFPTVEGEAKCL